MNKQESEMTKVFSLLMQISDNFAAEADAVIDWQRREVVITIDEGGKTIYAATVQLDSDAIEAKLRLIRHEIEQMKVASLAGRMGVAA